MAPKQEVILVGNIYWTLCYLFNKDYLNIMFWSFKVLYPVFHGTCFFFVIFAALLERFKDLCLRCILGFVRKLGSKVTLPETNSSPMKIPSFLVNTIKMVDFPWLC